MKPRIPILKKCCCFSVETGTIIIGLFDLISCISGLIMSSIFLHSYDADYLRTFFKEIRDEKKNSLEIDDYTIDLVVLWIKYILILWITLCCLVMLIISGLFVGMFKRKPLLLTPYLALKTLQGLETGICTLLMIYVMIFKAELLTGVILFLYSLAWTCLFVYMWIVVYSHYVVLKEENARGQYDKQAYRAS